MDTELLGADMGIAEEASACTINSMFRVTVCGEILWQQHFAHDPNGIH